MERIGYTESERIIAILEDATEKLNFLDLSYSLSYKDLDRGFLEILGPVGIIKTLSILNKYLKTYSSGNISHILFLLLLSIIIILIFYFIFVLFSF